MKYKRPGMKEETQGETIARIAKLVKDDVKQILEKHDMKNSAHGFTEGKPYRFKLIKAGKEWLCLPMNDAALALKIPAWRLFIPME